MRFFVGVTDYDWFKLHASNQRVEEVTFWRPPPDASFKALQVGEPFLFKLHSPRNVIAGGGFFLRFLRLPVSLAWDAFGEGNGARSPELMSPDNWESDFGFMQRPHAVRMHLALFYDYRTNVPLYPKWQAFLRERQPKTIIFWGQDDVFVTKEGGEAYLKDLPNAEMHRLVGGHFAVEDNLDYISSKIHRFYNEKVAAGRLSSAAPN